MKRVELIRQIEQTGCVFIRHGGRHDWFQNRRTEVCQPIPRHTEIKEPVARHILKMLRD
jgi:mRNA interferase HicA